jgi:hypothetical protein
MSRVGETMTDGSIWVPTGGSGYGSGNQTHQAEALTSSSMTKRARTEGPRVSHDDNNNNKHSNHREGPHTGPRPGRLRWCSPTRLRHSRRNGVPMLLGRSLWYMLILNFRHQVLALTIVLVHTTLVNWE